MSALDARIGPFVVACSGAAGLVVAGAVFLTAVGGLRAPIWQLVGVLAAGVVVTAFPLVLGSGRSRAAYVLDGIVFVMAVLLLPGPEAFLALTLPAAGYELVTGRRDLDRRLYFAAGTAVSNAAAIGLFSALATVTERTWAHVAGAILCAYLGLRAYHAGLVVMLRIGGRAHARGRELVPFLFPAPLIYGVSALVGALLAVVGQFGPVAFALALVTAIAFHLLYWEYRNMVLARTRTDRLFSLAADVPGLSTATAIERRARRSRVWPRVPSSGSNSKPSCERSHAGTP